MKYLLTTVLFILSFNVLALNDFTMMCKEQDSRGHTQIFYSIDFFSGQNATLKWIYPDRDGGRPQTEAAFRDAAFAESSQAGIFIEWGPEGYAGYLELTNIMEQDRLYTGRLYFPHNYGPEEVRNGGEIEVICVIRR